MSRRSKHKATENAPYRASEALYQALFEQATDGIFVADRQGRYVEVNPRGCEMLGYSREELLGLTMEDLIPDEDRTGTPLQLETLRAGTPLLKERRLRCKDGCFLPVEISARMLEDGSFLGMVRDISKRKQAAEALRASEERLQLALDAAQMGQWDWNIVTGEVDWSPKCLALHGLPPDTSMSYERFLQALHPEDRARIDAALRRSVEDGTPYDESKRTIWPDGSIHWTASRGQVYNDETGQPIRMIGVTLDISKWKEAEGALKKSHEELRAFFSQTIDGCFFMMLDEPVRWDETIDKEAVLDYVFAHQHLTQINEAMLAQYGATREQMLKLTPNDLFGHNLVHGRDLWRRLFDAGKIRLESDERKLDGTPMWIEGEYIVLYDAEGYITGHFGIQRDITERKQMEQALADKEIELRNLAESSPGLMGTFYRRPDGSVCMPYTSPRIWDLFGLRSEDVVDDATPLLARTHPDDADLVNESIAESARTLTPWNLEYRVLHPTRGAIWLEGSTNPKPHPDGGVIWYGFVHDITERKHAEAALRASEERFRTFVDHATDAFFLHADGGTILDVNQQACESLGYNYEELVGMTPYDFDAGTDRAFREGMRKRLDAGEVIAFDTLHRRKDGRVFPVEVRVRRFWQGERRFAISLARDITDRKRAQEALRASEERFRTFVDHAADAFFLHDEQGTILDVNRQACENLGYTYRELIGITPDDFDAGLDRSEADRMKERLDAGEVLAFDTLHRRKDGRVFPVELRVRPFWQGERRFAVSLARDITDRKRAQEALRASEERYRALYRDNPSMFFTLDADGTVISVNDFGAGQLGYTIDELEGASVLKVFHEADREAVTAQLQTCLQHPWQVFQWQFRKVRKDGSVLWVEEFGRAVQGTDGVTQVLVVCQDITERKQAEEERKALIAELETQNAELERFAYTFSHELKTPLVTIALFLGMLEKDATAGKTEHLHRDIQQIHRATGRMKQMLDELLELTRTGRLLNVPEEFALRDLVADAVAELARPIEERGIKIVIDPDLPVIYGDRTRLLELMRNLLNNAWKFMGEQADPRVEVGVRYEAEEPVFFVRDNGIGIAPQYHQKVFGLFERLDAQVEGTGVGLALAKRIVEVHGGRIWVESESTGQGSTFCFTLPGQKADEQATGP